MFIKWNNESEFILLFFHISYFGWISLSFFGNLNEITLDREYMSVEDLRLLILKRRLPVKKKRTPDSYSNPKK